MVSLIRSFRNKATEDLFNGQNSKEARQACPRSLWKVVAHKLDQLDSVEWLEELRVPPGNQLEVLLGDWKDFHSIRVNKQYRICFRWTKLGPDCVEIVDYH